MLVKGYRSKVLRSECDLKELRIDNCDEPKVYILVYMKSP